MNISSTAARDRADLRLELFETMKTKRKRLILRKKSILPESKVPRNHVLVSMVLLDCRRI